MTDRLYYRDPALLEFEGTIIAASQEGDRYATVLDRSAFYPTSGGQQFDTGQLNGVPVTDVIEAGDEVVHITAEAVGTVGQKVHGQVDRQRRLRHRQQHTAQHILSQAFIQLLGYSTVSVHLGEEYGAIELETAVIEPSQLARAEQQANEVVLQNWSVEILFVTGDEIAALPLRKIPSREGTLRVIKIGEFDWSACGGTHCASTAEVGIIKIVGIEKLRGRVLVKFLAGLQAMEDYSLRFDVTDALSKSLTCHVSDLPSKIGKLADENKSLRKEIGALQRELMPARAQALAQSATLHGSLRFVCKAMDSMDAGAASQLASAVAETVKGLAVFFAEGRLLIAVGPETGLHAGDLARKLGAQAGLKGGGSNRAAQLGGADVTKLDLYCQTLLTFI